MLNTRQKGHIRHALFCLLALPLAGLPFWGCSIASSFTGGGVPIGKAAIIGRAVSAINLTKVMPNAKVHLVASTRSKALFSYDTVTDSTGKFTFPEVSVGDIGAGLSISITPANGGIRPQSIAFTLNKDETANVVFTLVPYTYKIDNVSGFNLQPTDLALQSNAPNKITAQLIDPFGNVLPVAPTFVLVGNFSQVNADGTFIAGSSGVGVLGVYWYNDIQTSAVVTVSDDVVNPPPPPRHVIPQH